MMDAREVLDEVADMRERISDVIGRQAAGLHVSWLGDGPHVAVHLDDLRDLLDAAERLG